jgi:UDP-glucuronate 4-epimerase
MEALFATVAPDVVLHLAAQAGVRHSVTHPHAYAESNLTGFLHVLEGCRQVGVRHLVFASSSSVYGDSTTLPYRESDAVGHPVSLYAATKQAGEAMAYTYSHLFAVPTTGVRLFTVYGPWGRPDMAYYQFTSDILAGRPIRLFNQADMTRDFTYVDDVVEGMLRVAATPPFASARTGNGTPRADHGDAPARILNIGAGQPVQLERFLTILEESLGCRALREYVPMQPGDVVATSASVEAIQQLTGFRPSTSLEVGIPRFVEWYRRYHAGATAVRIPLASRM